MGDQEERGGAANLGGEGSVEEVEGDIQVFQLRGIVIFVLIALPSHLIIYAVPSSYQKLP